jgi:hypothetical protein
MGDFLKKYSKAIAAFVTSLVAVLGALVATGVLAEEPTSAVVAALIAVATALGVGVAPANAPLHGPR